MQKKYILSLRKESYVGVVQDGLSGSVPSSCLGGTMVLINARKEPRVDDWMTPLQIHRSRAHGSLTVS